MNIPPGPIETVFLDGDGTLWDEVADIRAGLEDVVVELSLHIATARLTQVSVQAFEQAHAQVRDRPGWRSRSALTTAEREEIRRESFALVLDRVGLDVADVLPGLEQTYFLRRWGQRTLFDDVPRAIDDLSGKYRLGLLSNGRSRPEQGGLAGVFDVVVLAGDVGHEKPHPAIFREALRLAKCERRGAVLVGDSPVADVQGARSFGMRSILVDRVGRFDGRDLGADAVVESLASVAEVLGRWSHRPDASAIQ